MNKGFFNINILVLVLSFTISSVAWSEVKEEPLKKSQTEIKNLTSKVATVNKKISKIGFVNVGQLLGAAPQAQKSRKILEKEFADRDKQLVEKQQATIDKEKQYQKDLAILSETQRSRRERELISLKRDFKRFKEEFEEDLALRKNEELRKLQKIVAVTIDKVAKKGGYDLIVNEGVVYASKDIDISLLILEELKKQAKSTKDKPKKK